MRVSEPAALRTSRERRHRVGGRETGRQAPPTVPDLVHPWCRWGPSPLQRWRSNGLDELLAGKPHTVSRRTREPDMISRSRQPGRENLTTAANRCPSDIAPLSGKTDPDSPNTIRGHGRAPGVDK
jgi:hypothetical protein